MSALFVIGDVHGCIYTLESKVPLFVKTTF